MKILHLLQSNQFSGAENVVCQIIGMFRDEPTIEMVYCSRDGQIRDALGERGIVFAPIKDLTISEVRRVIQEQRPDVIHAHDMRASFIAALTCGNIRLISHIHNSDFQARKISVKSLLYFCGSIKYSRIFWVSNSCYTTYRFHKFLSAKSDVLYNVIDQDAIYKKSLRDNTQYDYDVVYIGRLADPKNPMKLIRIAALVKNKFPHVKIGIVGTGDSEDVTKELAEKLDLKDNIVFHGFMSNPLGVLASSQVMVMTSDREGVPMCALEAMALGIPIISTPTDGLCDIVRDGVTGYLTNDESEFSERILSIITDKVKRTEFSHNTSRVFSELNNISQYKSILKDTYENK